MTTVVPYIPNSNDLAQLDPMQKMYVGYMAQFLNSPKTYEAYKADLANFAKYCAERNLNPLYTTRTDLEIYVAWLQQHPAGWSESTISRRVGTVRGMFTWAADEDIIVKNPASRIKSPRVDKDKQRHTFLRPLEHARFIDYVMQNGTPMEKAYLALVWLCALRIFEACSLNGSSYQIDGGYRVLVFTGKHSKARRVKVPVPAMSLIEAVITGPDEPILVNRAGRRMNRVNGDTMVKRLAREAGVSTDISNHSGRRSMVTTGKSSGLDYEDLAQILGHSSVATTQVYDRHAGSIHRNKVDQITGYLADLAS